MRTSAAFFPSGNGSDASAIFLGRICSPGLFACCLGAASSVSSLMSYSTVQVVSAVEQHLMVKVNVVFCYSFSA
jgi:hypothetical protein